MRALFGVVGLLLALVIVGLVAVKQLNAMGHSNGAASRAASAGLAAPDATAGGTVADQSRQLQDQVRRDVGKALEQGAARTEEAAK